MNRFLMGNEAIALGALHSGVNVVCGYPGTPSSEILESVAREKDGSVYVEWSVNEKAALEVAAGASYAGARTMVTMKQVGLNVASDPLMSLAYVGVKGGMVVVVADDPGPISSQTEQDTRTFGMYSKLPVFDPSSPEEAYAMVADAFRLSEEHGTPVILRPTTRVCHGYAAFDVADERTAHTPAGFVKDSRWVIFPRTSYLNHQKIEARNAALSAALSRYPGNAVAGEGRKGVAAGGVSYAYLMDALGGAQAKVLKVATPFPFPDELALSFLEGLDEVLVFEELDPVIERALLQLAGKHHLPVRIRGKLTGDAPAAGENSVDDVRARLHGYLGVAPPPAPPELPSLPVRQPVLCAGCPHRGSFYAVKRAMAGRKAVFTGDIGCYTLGNAQPLDMVDTCLCMGADITIAQGLYRVQPDVKHFAFIGDSTFFASGLTGVANAVYNGCDLTIVVLDNSTTAMTGGQPHPGTGSLATGAPAPRIDIEGVLRALGVGKVVRANPFRMREAVEKVREAAAFAGVSAVLFEAPCINLGPRPQTLFEVDAAACTGCRACIGQIGCPAVSLRAGKAFIEPSLCYGCSLCAQVCPHGAIKGV